jgi:uncharacterized protein (TIGR00251 family)
MFFIKETANGVIFHIHVVPKSAKNEVAGIQGDAVKLKINALPVEGQANAACVKFLSEILGVRKNQVAIVSGHKSRKKTVAIEGRGRKDIEAVISIPPSLPFAKPPPVPTSGGQPPSPL